MIELKSYIEYMDGQYRFKGTRVPIVDAINGMEARGDSIRDIASDFLIPTIAVKEAIRFLKKNPEIVIKYNNEVK